MPCCNEWWISSTWLAKTMKKVHRFNTASGNALLQLVKSSSWIDRWAESFNTASGNALLQLRGCRCWSGSWITVAVSIPQAVMPSCNSVLGIPLQDWAKNSDLDHRPLFRLFFTQISVDIVFIFAKNTLITRILPAFLLSTTLLDHRFSNFPLL